MKQVRYTDPAGRLWVTTVPDDAPDSHASMGIPYGPPSLASLDIPEDVEIRLHNALVEVGILTRNDFGRDHQRVNTAIRKAFRATLGDLERIFDEVG